jgi:hypothetical protein
MKYLILKKESLIGSGSLYLALSIIGYFIDKRVMYGFAGASIVCFMLIFFGKEELFK